MKMVKDVWDCICDRCSNVWVSRSSDVPKICPKCKSPKWDDADRVAVEKTMGARSRTLQAFEPQFVVQKLDPGELEVRPEVHLEPIKGLPYFLGERVPEEMEAIASRPPEAFFDPGPALVVANLAAAALNAVRDPENYASSVPAHLGEASAEVEAVEFHIEDPNWRFIGEIWDEEAGQMMPAEKHVRTGKIRRKQ
jgi:hypothetical protein